MTIIPDMLDRDNQTTPAVLIIHCPTVSQRHPWGEWAEQTLASLVANGWLPCRRGRTVHVTAPCLVHTVH